MDGDLTDLLSRRQNKKKKCKRLVLFLNRLRLRRIVTNLNIVHGTSILSSCRKSKSYKDLISVGEASGKGVNWSMMYSFKT